MIRCGLLLFLLFLVVFFLDISHIVVQGHDGIFWLCFFCLFAFSPFRRD